MQLLLPIIVIGVLAVIGVFVPKKNVVPKKDDSKVLSISTVQATPTPTPTFAPSVTALPSPTAALPSPTPFKTSANNSQDFVYPGSKILSPENGQMTLESTDSADTITNWYKNRIKSNGMNVTSFVTVITNGNVNNVLAGAKNGQEIKVTITKNAGQNTVRISISGNSS